MIWKYFDLKILNPDQNIPNFFSLKYTQKNFIVNTIKYFAIVTNYLITFALNKILINMTNGL